MDLNKVNLPDKGSEQQGEIRNHHIIPVAYQRGFRPPREKSRLYVYEKGKAYNPGIKPHNNPRLTSIYQSGMLRDYYAVTKGDGSTDYESYEKRLAKEEEKALGVLRLIRGGQEMPNTENRRRLINYMQLMIKRVDYRRRKIKSSWLDLVDKHRREGFAEMLLESCILQTPDAAELIKSNPLVREEMLRQIEVRTLLAYTNETRDSVMNEHMFSELPRVTAKIESMTWRFFVATGDQQFVTSDNPVYYSETYRLGSPDSELIFPISGHVCLHASSKTGIHEQYVGVNDIVVREVNERTVSRADKYLYSSVDSKELKDLLNNPPSSLPPMLF